MIVPLGIKRWFQRFCENHGLVCLEEEPSDTYQARITVYQDEETARLGKTMKEVCHLFDEVRRNDQVSRRKKACERFSKALTRLEGAMFRYPECCVEFHAERGPSSRAKAYEEFLQSGKDQSIPVEFWAVAHAPCGSTCRKTLETGRKYLDALADFSEQLKDHVKSRLLLPRFYQTGGGRFIDLQPLDYDQHREKLSISKEKFEEKACMHLPTPFEIVLCDVPRPYVIVGAPEVPPHKTSFPNPNMIGIMWLAFVPGSGAYMVNAKTGKLALYIVDEKWIPKVGEEWRSPSIFRIYRSTR